MKLLKFSLVHRDADAPCIPVVEAEVLFGWAFQPAFAKAKSKPNG